MWFSGNQMPRFMANSNETYLKKKEHLNKKSPQIMLPVAKN